jgi:hypothetical protein
MNFYHKNVLSYKTLELYGKHVSHKITQNVHETFTNNVE